MKLELNLKNQDAYTVEDIQASMLVLAGELGKLGYCLDGLSYNTDTPITGLPLKNTRADKYLKIESNLDKSAVYSDNREIETITIDATGAGVNTRLVTLAYVRYNRMLTTNFSYAVSMVEKIAKRRHNRFSYSNRRRIQVTKSNVKLVRGIKGFKTAKLDDIALYVSDLGDLDSKRYTLENIKTGTEKTFTLNR
ncbi:hypothetical protein HOS78_gp129 [Lactobacillus phage Bacchae]|uniref:Uncharacterized protein n=1 Tax=Lactobacillus phage Bacchae TaxID=2079429 RepID=A0A2K9VCY9_9CAUD|nr:hypothetical protein HOS78_gp129 [Lactobacillus phage Bacchae]AUV60065.1 hypothetical protein [Lactobacillus phage Bacchae]